MSEDNLEDGTVVVEEPVIDETETEVDPFEDRARRMGWRPLAEYSGDKSRWVSAEEFVKRGETELPILRERYRRLDDRLANTEKQLEESNRRQSETVKVLQEVREMSKGAEERAYAKAMAELGERERKAVAEAQVEEYDRIQRERRTIEETRPKPVVVEPTVVEQPRPTTNPVIDAWVADNPWFNSDPILNSMAIALDGVLQRESAHLGVSDRLAEVKKQVMSRFPEKFGNPRRAAPATVTTTHLASPRSTKKGVKDLPKEAQEAFARFKKQMPSYTEDEYLKVYGEM